MRLTLNRTDLADPTELHRRACRGDVEARNAIVEANTALAGAYVRKYARVYRHLTDEEALCFALEGLMVAASKFDPDRGSQFSTVAYWWMRCHVSRGNAIAGSEMGTPIHAIQGRAYYLSKLTPRAASRLVAQLARKRHGTDSLAMLAIEDETADPARGIDIAEAELACDRLDWSALSIREARAVRLYFGLAGESPKSYREVALAMQTSKQRAHQLVSTGLDRLRGIAGAATKGGAA